ncbi:MAG: hypothetical protein RLO12_00725, partial [Fulvivirga sp.]
MSNLYVTRRIKFLLSLIVTSLLSNTFAHSQDIDGQFPSVNIVSPSASAIAKHVDFPVNQHTGVPEVNIPIYTVQEGPLSFQISLSYHASGLKVMELASWVGAGWSLNAGGVVSRTVKGKPDEYPNYDGDSFFTNGGFSDYFLDLNGRPDYRLFLDGMKDSEPDIFTFSCGPYSGKFYFREDYTPVIIPESDVKIEAIVKDEFGAFSYDHIQGFKIITPAGVKYYFGVTDDPYDVDPVDKSGTEVIGGSASFSQVYSSWYLNKIESADSKFSIDISYREENYGYFTISSQPCMPNCDNSIKLIKTGISGVAISSIDFSNGSVEFVANNLRQDVVSDFLGGSEGENTGEFAAKSLDGIIIKSNQSNYSKEYKLSYDYFEDNSTEVLPYLLSQYNTALTLDRKRLKLISLQELEFDEMGSSSVQSIPSYNFHYYDDASVPRRISFAQDHWGFSNGAKTNEDLMPAIRYNNYNGGDRDAHWPEMRAGALKYVQYPSGGGTEYIYEPNRVTTINNCVFQKEEAISGTSAGMGGPDSGFGSNYDLNVESSGAYYFKFISEGSGSGKLYIDNSVIANIGSGESAIEDFIFLNAGTYSFRCYANEDSGSGTGVRVEVHAASASCDPAQEKMVGGLRIKRINKFGTIDSPPLSMNYEYGSGNLYSIPVYIFKLKNDFLKSGFLNGTEEGCSINGGGNNNVRTFISPVSSQPLQTIQGYHIGYNQVTERQTDGGYIISEFKGHLNLPPDWYTLEDVCVRDVDSSVCSFKDSQYPVAPLAYDFERGNLKSKHIYSKDGLKLKEILYSE